MLTPSQILRLIFAFLIGSSLLAAESTPPKPIKTVRPDYPALLVEELVEGKAVVVFVVGIDGKVTDATIKSSDHESFGEAALAAVARWEFEPATKNGEAVAQKVSLPLLFKPSGKDRLNKMVGRNMFTQLAAEPVPLKELGQRPRPVFRPRASYPSSMVGSGEERSIRMKFIIGYDGLTYNPDIVEKAEDADRMWAMAAVATVSAMRFEPMKLKGDPVLVEMNIPVLITEKPPEPQGRGRGGRGGR